MKRSGDWSPLLKSNRQIWRPKTSNLETVCVNHKGDSPIVSALVIFWFGFHYYVILPIFNHTTFSYCNIEEIFSKRFAVLSLCIFSLWRILFLWLGRFGSSSQISYAKLTLECLFSLMNGDDMFATFATRCIRIGSILILDSIITHLLTKFKTIFESVFAHRRMLLDHGNDAEQYKFVGGYLVTNMVRCPLKHHVRHQACIGLNCWSNLFGLFLKFYNHQIEIRLMIMFEINSAVPLFIRIQFKNSLTVFNT
ncbi:hypothetical protein DERF_004348 [Dermatophagoides farinae]|uniref:Uncharacterized protein n=1 Tax=Dermatophagoides farinae TaxID=6954 RepID=A0A922I5W9_DERFA|nr:hypothetical protein DERF_004348 [Dermatophagoides farinae]